MEKSEGSIYLGYLSLPTLSRLAKGYSPSSTIYLKIKTLDLLLLTDEQGRVQRFRIGRLGEGRKFIGEEFERLFMNKAGQPKAVEIKFLGKYEDL